MSIWTQYTQLMKPLLKTAAKEKENDYEVVIDDQEETGQELIERAHPDQVRIMDSYTDDGIVENGIEQQKADIEIALRTPRANFAQKVITTLTKIANELDENGSKQALVIANDIDNFIKKMAQATNKK